MGVPKKLLFLLLLFPLALCAKARTGKAEGVLNGYVTDAVTKKPLCGVMVFASIPGSGDLREAITDSAGYFSFLEIPATQVTVEFNKKGYRSFKRPNVTIKEKASVKLNVEFLPSQEELNSATSEFPVLHLLDAL
jgi:hypothetical protein